MDRQRVALGRRAIVIQPLVLLMFPLAFVRTQRNQRAQLCLLGALPSVVLVGNTLISQWDVMSKILLHQQNFQFLDHATPWVAISPHTQLNQRRSRPGSPDRHRGCDAHCRVDLPMEALADWPPVALRPDLESPVRLRGRHAFLLPRSSPRHDRDGVLVAKQLVTLGRCWGGRCSGDGVRVPPVLRMGVLDADGRPPGCGSGLFMAWPPGPGAVRASILRLRPSLAAYGGAPIAVSRTGVIHR